MTPAEDRLSMGNVIIVLLGGTLAGLSDRLAQDGFREAADLVTDLVEIVDDYVTRIPA